MKILPGQACLPGMFILPGQACLPDKEILAWDKTSLDIYWLKDKSLADLDNLPEPEVLAEENFTRTGMFTRYNFPGLNPAKKQ